MPLNAAISRVQSVLLCRTDRTRREQCTTQHFVHLFYILHTHTHTNTSFLARTTDKTMLRVAQAFLITEHSCVEVKHLNGDNVQAPSVQDFCVPVSIRESGNKGSRGQEITFQTDVTNWGLNFPSACHQPHCCGCCACVLCFCAASVSDPSPHFSIHISLSPFLASSPCIQSRQRREEARPQAFNKIALLSRRFKTISH